MENSGYGDCYSIPGSCWKCRPSMWRKSLHRIMLLSASFTIMNFEPLTTHFRTYSRNRLYLFQESQSPIHTPWYQACYTSWHWTQIFARKKLIGYYDNRGKKNLLFFMLRNRKYVHYMWSKFKVVPLESSSSWQTQDL